MSKGIPPILQLPMFWSDRRPVWRADVHDPPFGRYSVVLIRGHRFKSSVESYA